MKYDLLDLRFQAMGCNKGKKNKKIDSYEVSRLYEALAQFFAELRKENGKEYSLRSKHFQSSYCVKIRAGAKKRVLLSQLSRRTRVETLTTKATKSTNETL